jgi:hypothetical protein
VVGRKEPLETILLAYQDAVAEPWPQVVEVVGVGGVGKTALLATAATSLADAGAPIRYAAWLPTPFATLDPLWRAGLLPLPPDRASASAALSPAELAERVLGSLQALGEGGMPPVVIFDDLHWLPAGVESLLATVVARHEGGALFLLAHRPEPRGGQLESVVPPAARRIQLEPFTTDEMAQLLAGDPARARDDTPRWVAAALLAPERPGRFDRLTVELSAHAPETRHLVELLAFHPEGLSAEVLRTGAGLPADLALEHLRRLVEDGLVVEIPSTPPRFALVHELVARRVQEEMAPARRTEVLAVLHDTLRAAGTPPSARVHHALGAAELIGPDAAGTVVAAARSLAAAGVHADAVALAEEVRRRGVPLSVGDRAVVDAVEQYARVGLGESLGAAAVLLELAERAADAGDWAAVAAIVEYRQLLGRPEVVDEAELALVRRGIEAVGHDDLRVRFALLSSSLFDAMYGGRRPDEVVGTPEQMLVVADALGDPALQAAALAADHWYLSATGAPQADLEARTAALLGLAETTRDPGITSRAHAAAIGTAMHRHDLVAVRGHVDAILEDPDPLGRWQAVLARSALLIDEGDLARAERAIQVAEEQAVRRGVRNRREGPTAQRFVIAWARGGLAGWRPLLEGTDWRAPGRPVWGVVLAATRLHDRDGAGAAAVGREVAERALADQDWFARFIGAVLAEIAHFTGDGELAALVRELLGRWTGRRVFVGAATVDLGPVDHYLALAHALGGSAEEAARLHIRAVTDAACPLWSQRVERPDTGQLVAPDGTPWGWIA